jgi:hypothetical protein
MPLKLAQFGLSLFVLLALATGCGAVESSARSGTTTENEVVVRVEPAPAPDPGEPLPSDVCFVAVRNYELALVVDEGATPSLCERLAGYLPSGAGRGDWPAPLTGDEDQDTPTLECAVGGEGVRVEVLVWNRDSTPLFGTDVCEAMILDDWELQPLSELGGEDLQPGTCFVATAHYEVELAGETERGQSLCEDLAESYLRAPIVHRSPPVAEADAMGETVCEAWHKADHVRLISMPADRGAIDLLAVCDALERDGWKALRWDHPSW